MDAEAASQPSEPRAEDQIHIQDAPMRPEVEDNMDICFMQHDEVTAFLIGQLAADSRAYTRERKTA